MYIYKNMFIYIYIYTYMYIHPAGISTRAALVSWRAGIREAVRTLWGMQQLSVGPLA